MPTRIDRGGEEQETEVICRWKDSPKLLAEWLRLDCSRTKYRRHRTIQSLGQEREEYGCHVFRRGECDDKGRVREVGREGKKWVNLYACAKGWGNKKGSDGVEVSPHTQDTAATPQARPQGQGQGGKARKKYVSPGQALRQGQGRLRIHNARTYDLQD